MKFPPMESIIAPMKKRKVVEISEASARRRSRKWAFGYPDLAAVSGMTERSVKAAVLRRSLDPTNLLDLAYWIALHRRDW